MKKWSRLLLIGVCILILWTSACNLPAPTPPPLGTILPNGQSLIPTSTGLIPIAETNTPPTPVIPITGENAVQMQCQFCVNGFTHVVFIFPDTAIFDIQTTTPVTCLTAEVVNGKRVLVCNGTQSTSFNLKICSDNSNCLLYPVALQPCPLAVAATPVTTITPVFLTAINTLLPPSRTPKPRSPTASEVPTQTSVVSTAATPTTGSPPAPTTTPIAPQPTSTSAPPPTPADTLAPTSVPSDGQNEPTKAPKSKH